MKYFILLVVSLVIGAKYASHKGHQIAQAIAMQASKNAGDAIEKSFQDMGADIVKVSAQSVDSGLQDLKTSTDSTRN